MVSTVGIRDLISDVLTHESGLLETMIEVFGAETVKDTIMMMNGSIESEDWTYLADIIESRCIPALELVYQGQDDIQNGNYIIESTPSGYMTVRSLVTGNLLHSCTDPMWEAEQLAMDIYEPVFRGYIVWGCGLGYFPLKLAELTDGSTPITVFEEDPDLIELGRKYGCVDEFDSKNITLVCDPKASLFTSEIDLNPDYCIMVHRASVCKIIDTGIRDALLRFYEHIYEPVRMFSEKSRRNYYSNVSLGLEYVDEIRPCIEGRKVVIAAAGPSLDDSLDFFTQTDDMVIITVGTVLKKLLKLGIRPDYCVMLDPAPIMYQQVEGVLDCGVPLILGLSTYWKIGRDYKGKRYLAVTSGMTGVPEVYSHSDYIFEVGSSVITLAIDIAMQMNASEIYLAGADMAYRNGMYHADGTPFQIEKNDNELIPVEGTQGDIVYTTPTLNEFRLWIEKEINKYPSIPVYNLSGTGALIHGTHRIKHISD